MGGSVDLDLLDRGDLITVESITGTHTYEVVEMTTKSDYSSLIAEEWGHCALAQDSWESDRE